MTLLSLSGIAYAIPLYADRWFFIDITLPISNSTLMALHGAGAVLMAIIGGMLWQAHAKLRLPAKKRANSGLGLLSILLILAASGYALYYAGNQTVRQYSGDIHTLMGCALPLVLMAHRLPIVDFARRLFQTA